MKVWLESREHCNGFSAVQDIVLPLEMLQKFSHTLVYGQLMGATRGGAFQPHSFHFEEQSFIPEAIPFLKLFPAIKHLELGIQLKLPGATIGLPLPAATALYDLSSLYSLTSLTHITLHFDYGMEGGNCKSVKAPKDSPFRISFDHMVTVELQDP